MMALIQWFTKQSFKNIIHIIIHINYHTTTITKTKLKGQRYNFNHAFKKKVKFITIA